MERMSWLSKLNPRGAGHRTARSASLQSPVTADPETCLMVFKNHWSQVSEPPWGRAQGTPPGQTLNLLPPGAADPGAAGLQAGP